MKVTALIENTASENLCGEHGLAVHIEYNGKQYLLDTGASDAFLENARRLGIDLAKIDMAFLSHSHYDHSGGFAGFFAQNKNAKVLVQKKAEEPCYAKVGFLKKYIGVPPTLFETYKERFVFLEDIYEAEKGVWVLPHKTEGLWKRGKQAHMYRKQENVMRADDFAHEQSIVFETEKGLIVLNSCSHAGIDCIVEEVLKAFPGKRVYAVIGGFHLMGLKGAETLAYKKEEVIALGKNLFDKGVQFAYTGHCTGKPAFEILKHTYGERVQYFATGTMIEF